MNYREEAEKRKREREAAEAALRAAEWEAKRPQREAAAAQVLKAQREAEAWAAHEQAVRGDYQRFIQKTIARFKTLQATEILRKVQKELWNGEGQLTTDDKGNASLSFTYSDVQYRSDWSMARKVRGGMNQNMKE